MSSTSSAVYAAEQRVANAKQAADSARKGILSGKDVEYWFSMSDAASAELDAAFAALSSARATDAAAASALASGLAAQNTVGASLMGMSALGELDRALGSDLSRPAAPDWFKTNISFPSGCSADITYNASDPKSSSDYSQIYSGVADVYNKIVTGAIIPSPTSSISNGGFMTMETRFCSDGSRNDSQSVTFASGTSFKIANYTSPSSMGEAALLVDRVKSIVYPTGTPAPAFAPISSSLTSVGRSIVSPTASKPSAHTQARPAAAASYRPSRPSAKPALTYKQCCQTGLRLTYREESYLPEKTGTVTKVDSRGVFWVTFDKGGETRYFDSSNRVFRSAETTEEGGSLLYRT